jgi:dephospho-CoA kinase
MFVVGLTGGIGSGKSTVADLFAERGVAVIDTDVIAHQLTAAGGAALRAIHAQFGDPVMQADGTLNRAALRQRIFSDIDARRQLEGILHPRIRQQVEQALTKVTAPYALIVIPLLVETGGYREMLNRILVVDCPEDVQIARVMARSGLSPDEVRAILAAQVRRDQRLAAADDVVVNMASIEALRDQVEALHQRYLARSTSPLP